MKHAGVELLNISLHRGTFRQFLTLRFEQNHYDDNYNIDQNVSIDVDMNDVNYRYVILPPSPMIALIIHVMIIILKLWPCQKWLG